jgi:phosphoribosylaminoimidazolecarboxamide formyltransferase / IMP cyclohydrolase
MSRGTDVTDFKRTYRTVVKQEFTNKLKLRFELLEPLRYGENPNQPAAVYRLAISESPGQVAKRWVTFSPKPRPLADLIDIRLAKSGKGGISATNFMDVSRGLQILKYFSSPSVAVMKHNIPSGFATSYGQRSIDECFESAWLCDPRSAFGSIVIFNRPVSKSIAGLMEEKYIEGIAAPEYEEGVMEMLEKKKDLRVMRYANIEMLPKFIGDDTRGLYDIKMLPTGHAVIQKPYLSSIRTVDDLVLDPLIRAKTGTYVVQRDPGAREVSDMFTSWYVNIGVRSNGVVIVLDGVTLAVGSGQQERVGAVEQADLKAYQKAMLREDIKYDPLYGIVGSAEVLEALVADAHSAGIWEALHPGEERPIVEKPMLAYERLSTNPLKGAVCSSDAFFPFRDSIDILGRAGVSAVIQPGGSVKDYEVIEAVNEHKMAMAFTRERCFGHF